MKKIIICFAALMMLVACNNSKEKQVMAENEAVEAIAEEMDGWKMQTALLANKPMVVDFYATWCGPCKQLAPVLDEIEKKYHGEVIFKRIDVDENQDLAQEFHIEAIPMIMFTTPKGEYKTLVGFQEAPVIEDQIDELLAHSKK